MGYEIKNLLIKAPFKGLYTEYPADLLPPEASKNLKNIDFTDTSIKLALGIEPIMNQGTGTITTSGTTVTGTGTQFTTELQAGWFIVIGSEKREIASISSDTSLTLTGAFSQDYTTAVPFWYIQVIPEDIYHLSKWLVKDGTKRYIILGDKNWYEYNPQTKKWQQMIIIWDKGTVSTTANSAVITGTNTSWLISEAQANDTIVIDSVGTFTIQSIDSDTQITLTATVPSTVSNTTYRILKKMNNANATIITSQNMWDGTDQYIIFDIQNKWAKVRAASPTATHLRDLTTDLADGYIKAELIEYWKWHCVHAKTYEQGVYYPTRIRLSANNDINKYNPQTSDDAYCVDLQDSEGEITAIKVIGDDLIIFKATTTYVAKYVGLPIIVVIQKISDDIGCKAQHSIVNYKDILFFLGEDGIYTYSGNKIEKISEPIATYFSSIKRNINYSRVFASYIDIKKQYFIWIPFAVPQDNLYGIGLGYHILTGQWTKYEIPNIEFRGAVEVEDIEQAYIWDYTRLTWDKAGLKWQEAYMRDRIREMWFGIKEYGATKNYNYVAHFTSVLGGLNLDYEGYYATSILDLGNPYIIKRLNRIQFITDEKTSQKLYVKIRYGDTPDGMFESDEYEVSDITIYPYLDVSYKAKFFQILIRADSFFSLTGINLIYMATSVKAGTKPGGTV